MPPTIRCTYLYLRRTYLCQNTTHSNSVTNIILKITGMVQFERYGSHLVFRVRITYKKIVSIPLHKRSKVGHCNPTLTSVRIHFTVKARQGNMQAQMTMFHYAVLKTVCRSLCVLTIQGRVECHPYGSGFAACTSSVRRRCLGHPWNCLHVLPLLEALVAVNAVAIRGEHKILPT